MNKLLTTTLLTFSLAIAPVFAQNEIIQVGNQINDTNPYEGLKRKVAILRFSNETQYGKGIFYNKENDPMAQQALDILSTRLAQSGKFIMLERNDLAGVIQEASLGKMDVRTIGADYVIIGSITQYGRKNEGDAGVFRSSKTQIVEAGVAIRIVDVSSGLIIYSEEGKGRSEVKTKQTLGVGAQAGFDATLSDKAIAAAISQLVENIINNCTNQPWKSYFLAYEDDTVIISGGKSQGIRPGDTFQVMKKGKTVNNPQTGMNIELPGKEVGTITVLSTEGATPDTEYSLVSFIEGNIEPQDLENYFIKEN